MANGVVHIFQVVEVNKEHRGSRFQSAAAVERLGKFAQEQHAVRKASERIMGGLASEFVLQLFRFSDVAGNGAEMLHHTTRIAHYLQGESERAHNAIGATKTEFAFPPVCCRVGVGGIQYFTWHLVANGAQESVGNGVVVALHVVAVDSNK